MKFAEPIWLLVGLAVIAVLLGLYRRFDARQRAALAQFASNHLINRLTASFSPGRRRVKRALFVAAIALTFVALARPQLGFHWEEQKRRGIDILFAIDTSKSMLTQDVTPDRLTRAKLAITDLVNRLDGDRVGLIAFAGDAFLQAPLTLDYNAFQESLDAVDTNTILLGGTNVASAIQEAQAALGAGTKNRKILVLITDGEDLEAKGIDAAKAAAKDGLTIYTVGVGSAAGGLIPLPGDNGGTDFLKDSSGQYVRSHLDENTLRQIAQATGGLYEPLGQQGQGLQALYAQALAPLPKQDLASRTQKVYDERFQWPLSAALACLMAGQLIGTRRRERKRLLVAQNAWQPVSAVGMFVLMLMTLSAQASPQSAEQAYKKGEYSVAEKQYEQAAEQHPQAAPLQFNLGASAYKNGEYDTALPAFQKALDTDQVGVQQQAYYDIGNTQYRRGQKTEKSAVQETIKAWQGAVQSYDAALKLKPDDADAKFNRDFVQKKLDQLQKQNPQKQDQQNQKQDQKNQDQQNQQSQQQSGSQQQNQNQQNQQQSGSQQNQQNQNQSQDNQAQNGNQQNQNGQQGRPKDQQSGQQQTAGNQDQQKNGGGDQNQQLAQNNLKPAGQRGQTIPDKDSSKQQSSGDEAQAQADMSGQMSPQEAKDLLNSLRNGEHVLPATADARNGGNHSPDDQPLKDW
ncbi:MAG: VWA domain-containing protein [Methylacidiphilales bacterium]|nr:VWA domain-containing protein [Candidatus Methylacidiphilales bacterium]